MCWKLASHGCAPQTSCASRCRTAPPPFLVSAVGDDAAGSLLLAQLAGQGLSTQGVLRCRNAATPCVSLILDRGAPLCQSAGPYGLASYGKV